MWQAQQSVFCVHENLAQNGGLKVVDSTEMICFIWQLMKTNIFDFGVI